MNLDAYFERIHFDGTAGVNLETLTALHHLHPCAIPFENLDVLLRVPISLSVEGLEHKLVHEGRGGYCYEHNSLFAAVLENMGFPVTRLAARVEWNRTPDDVGTRTHSLLLTSIGDDPYLVDVGFSGMTLSAPLKLDERGPQQTSVEPFKIVDVEGELELQVLKGGKWLPVYRFDLQPQLAVDYELGSFWVANHAPDLFTSNIIASRLEGSTRVNLINGVLTKAPRRGSPSITTLNDASEVRRALENELLIRLPPDEGVDVVLNAALQHRARVA